MNDDRKRATDRAGRSAARSVLAVALIVSGCNTAFGIHPGSPRPVCVDSTGQLIDDMEDGDSRICDLEGRHGSWYTVSDGSSTDITPSAEVITLIPDGPRGTSRYAAHMGGSGFNQWGTILGLGLAPKTFDATGAEGIKFWMRSTTPVQVKVLIPETVQQENGGTCDLASADPNCNNHFAY